MKSLMLFFACVLFVSYAQADTLYLYGAQREAYQQEWEERGQAFKARSQNYLENLYATHGTVNGGPAQSSFVEPPAPPASSQPMTDTQQLDLPALADDFNQ